VRVLSTGIDTLNLAAKGVVRTEVWELVEEAQQRARLEEELQPVEFPVTAQAFLVKPHGLRGYAYWLTSPDFELILGKSEKFPPVLVQLHSAYMHSVGIDRALDLMEALLKYEIFIGDYRLNVSRIDVYADFQGWEAQLADLDRFVSFSRHRRGFQANQQVYMTGARLTGFMFGKGDLAARIYDKTVEIQRHGVSWLPDLWGTDGVDRSVWRLEFQFRRAVLAEFNLTDVDETVGSVQDLWRYATERWMSLRVPSNHSVHRRWPVDPVWEQIRRVRVIPSMTGVVRKRVQQASELRLLQGLQGYATSLAALRDHLTRDEALEDIGRLVDGYLSSRGRRFESEVRRKQDRQMAVTAYLDPELVSR
jgi:hypothetical protein